MFLMHVNVEAAAFMSDILKESRNKTGKCSPFYHLKRHMACVLFSPKWKLDNYNYGIFSQTFPANVQI